MKITASNNHAGTLAKATLLAAALLGYTSLVHLAILLDNTGIAFLLLLIPMLLLLAGNPAVRAIILLSCALAIYLRLDVIIEQGPPLHYLPPILINLFLATLFGRTLLPGQIPIITRYSIALRGGLDPRVAAYTRRVTQVWTGFFLFIAGESLLLAMFAPVEIWSLFANVLNYIFTALLFIGEYMFRVRRLSMLEHPGFLRFVTAIANTHVSKIHRT